MNKHLIGTGLVIAVVAAAAYAVASDDERRGPNHVRARLVLLCQIVDFSNDLRVI
jgi:hypothetical protein